MLNDPVEPWLKRVIASFNAGRRSEADDLCSQALRLHPDHPALNHLGAVLRLESGDAPAALLRARRSLAGQPDDPRVLATAARAARAAGDAALALQFARRAVELVPGSPELACQHAALQIECGLADDARARLEAMAAREPAHAGLWYELGRACRALGDAATARAAFSNATRLDPQLVPAWFALSLVLQDAGATGPAAQALDRTLALDPLHAEAAVNLGLIRQAEGQLEAAMASYARAYRARPDSLGRIAHALCSLPCGALWTDRGQLERALRDALVPERVDQA